MKNSAPQPRTPHTRCPDAALCPRSRRAFAFTPRCAAPKRQRAGGAGGSGASKGVGASGGPSPSQQAALPAMPAGGKPLSRSVRAMPIRVVSVSKANSAGANAFTEEWLGKLRRYTAAEVVTVKPNPLKAKDVEVAKQAEAQKVRDGRGCAARLEEVLHGGLGLVGCYEGLLASPDLYCWPSARALKPTYFTSQQTNPRSTTGPSRHLAPGPRGAA